MKTKLRLFCLLLCLSIFSNTFAFTIDKFVYSINPDSISVTLTYASNKLSGNISIPPTVTYENKVYNVTCIGDKAFAYCYNLAGITIPNSVTSIESSAFQGCI